MSGQVPLQADVQWQALQDDEDDYDTDSSSEASSDTDSESEVDEHDSLDEVDMAAEDGVDEEVLRSTPEMAISEQPPSYPPSDVVRTKKNRSSLSMEALYPVKQKASDSRSRPCPACGEAVPYNQTLYHHRQRRCVKELPETVVCTICGKEFSRDSSLQRHLQSKTACQSNLKKAEKDRAVLSVRHRNAITKAIALERQKLRAPSNDIPMEH